MRRVVFFVFFLYFCGVNNSLNLNEIYSGHPLLTHFKGKTAIRLKGLSCSSRALLAVAVIQQMQGNHIFVLPDGDLAAYFQNDLSNILGDDKIYYFPSSYKRMTTQMQPQEGNIIMRTRTLEALLDATRKSIIIVTHPHALAEKVVSGVNLRRNTLQLRKGEKISIEFIRDALHEYNFKNCDFVYEPGQFSIR